MNEKPYWFSSPFARVRTPKSAEQKSVATPNPQGFVALHTMMGAGWTNASYGALSREGFMRNPVVHRCVRIIAETAGSLPWLAYDGDSEIAEHPALKSLQKPNAHQSKAEFIEAICGHLLLSGNAYVERNAGHLYVLRPDKVSCELDEAGWPSAYLYQAGSNRRRIPVENADGTSTVLHLKLFHPLDDQSGFPPLQAALMALDTHNSAATWNKALLDNEPRPSGALVYAPGDGSNLSPEQYEQLKRQLEEGYAGASNAGKPLLLEGGLDWKSMGLSPKDMDFIEAKNSASRDIALAFGVPPMLLGIPGDNTYANYQKAHRGFFRLTVLPMLRRIKDAMAAWLVPDQSSRFRVEFDLDQVESLTDERDALWRRLEEASFLTQDEKRAATGYSPHQADVAQ